MTPPAQPGLTRRTLTGLFWTAWGKGAYTGLKLLVLAVLARLLAPADFGVVSAAFVVIGFSAVFSQLGLGPALVQRPELEQRHVNTAFTTSLLFGVLLGALVWLGAGAAARFQRMDGVEPVLHALAWVFPLQGLSVVADARLRRELRFQWLANLEVVTYAVGYGLVGIGLAFAGFGVWALVAGQMTQVALRCAILVVAEPPRWRPPFELRAFRELFYFGSGFTLARVGNYIALQADNIVVGRYLGAAALGFYSRAYGLMSAPAHSFGAVLDLVLFPAMAKVQHDPQRLALAYRRGVALIALLTLAPSAAFIVLGPEVVRLALGSAWALAVPPFQILAVGMLFRTSYKMSEAIARSTGAVYRRAWRQMLYAVLVVLGAYVGQFWGIAGVAWGTVVALAVNFVLMAHLSLVLAGLTWTDFWRAHLPAVRLTLACLPVVWVTTTALRYWNLPAIVVLATAAIAATGLTVLLWRSAPERFLGAEGLWILNELRGYRPGRRAGPGRAPPLVELPEPQSSDAGAVS